jgi:hypothetical protein
VRRRTLIVGVVATLLSVLLFPSVGGAAPAALLPVAGTGHGVLGGPPPAEGGSLSYGPGLGAACQEEANQVSASPMTYAYGQAGRGVAAFGLPVNICLGHFPSPTISLTITPPRGSVIRLPDQTSPATSSSASTSVEVNFLASPPTPRWEVERYDATTKRLSLAASGRLSGDGSGRYLVRASGGGVEATATFALAPPLSPRIGNSTGGLTTFAEPGRRISFGAAGQRPLATFRVGIYGPNQRGPDGRYTSPLATMITARANRRGEAIIALDIASGAHTGSYDAFVNPDQPLVNPNTLDPRVALFRVCRGASISNC